jgi:hypothetical protein
VAFRTVRIIILDLNLLSILLLCQPLDNDKMGIPIMHVVLLGMLPTLPHNWRARPVFRPSVLKSMFRVALPAHF